MKKISTHILLTVALALMCVLQGAAQGTTSPYSIYGYGLLGESSTGTQRAMGGVGYAMHNGRQVNTMNPAAYAHTDSLTFLWDVGLDLTFLTSTEGETKAKSIGGGLDYIAMQFPLSKTVGMSIGTVPLTSVGYTYGGTLSHGTDNRVGEGGINKVYAGVAWAPFKGLSAGVNFDYEFGSILHSAFVSNTVGSTTLFERNMQVRTWGMQFGLQGVIQLNRFHSVSLGAVFTPGKSLRGQTWGAYYDYTHDQGETHDSIGFTKLNGKYSMPATYGVGLGYKFGERLYLEVDATYQPWSKAKYAPIEGFDSEVSNMEFKDRIKFGAGVEFSPRVRGNFFQVMCYRLGVNFNNDYMQIKGERLKDYTVSLGLGLPAPNSKTVINLGVEYKRRTTTNKSLVNESYINLTLGVTFNEAWFFQSMIR